MLYTVPGKDQYYEGEVSGSRKHRRFFHIWAFHTSWF